MNQLLLTDRTAQLFGVRGKILVDFNTRNCAVRGFECFVVTDEHILFKPVLSFSYSQIENICTDTYLDWVSIMFSAMTI